MPHTEPAFSLLLDDSALANLRAFLSGLPREPDAGDFEEQIQLPNIRSTMRLWQGAQGLAAFAYVDTGRNLRFEIHPAHHSDALETEIVEWGLACIRKRNAETGALSTLDASCAADDAERLVFLERFGFAREPIRSLKYSRSLAGPVEAIPFPAGFSLRSAAGESEVEALVALHRAAFGTENMTVEERLAIMRAPSYLPELDLVAVAPDASLAAFCICGLEGEAGYTDPIGAHPRYRRLGLGKAIVSAGLRGLQERGALRAETGTSSENIPMQRLAERMGFACVSERLWFSKEAV